MPLPGKGDRVRYTVRGESLEGRVAKVKGDVVFLKTSEPVHFMDSTDGVALGEITADMARASVDAIGYGLVQALEDQGIHPSGRWRDDKRLFVLDKRMPVRKVLEFCRKFHPGVGHCWFSALTMTVVPVHTDKGEFEELD